MKRLRIKLLFNNFYIFIFIFAIIYFVVYDNIIVHKSYYNKIVNEEFVITKINKTENGYSFYLKGKEIVIGYINENKYDVGDKVIISGTNVEIEPITLKNNFDYKKYLYHNHIYHVIDIDKIKLLNKNNNIIYKIKEKLNNRCNNLKSGSFINYLIFNKKDTYEQAEFYNESGINHLFSVSGLHLSILVLSIKKILFFLNKHKTNLIIFILLFIYLSLTDFPVSLLRASMFYLLLTINKEFNLKQNSLKLLIVTISIIIILDPFNIYNIGFQFSSLLSFFLLISNNKKSFLKKQFNNSIICLFASFPIIINNFYEINIVSFVNNLICIPVMSYLILPLSIITIIFPVFDQILFNIISVQNLFLNFTLNNMSINIIFCKLNFFFYLIYYLIFYLVIKRKKLKIKIILLIFIIIWYICPINNKNEVIYVDVGEGNSVILQVNNTTSLIDTGGFYMKNDSKYTYKYSKRLLLYLKSKGIRKIDNLFLSHGDRDHIKEASYLLNNFKISNLYLNSNELTDLEKEAVNSAKKNKINIYILNKDEKINLNGNYLININNAHDNENDSSLVLYTKINNYKLLFTGDISKKIENELISEYNLSNIDILLVGHHGSNTSSSYEFLQKTNPKYAIISSGKNNIYHHPSVETINNLEKLQIEYKNTANCSTIYFNLKNGTILTNN